MNRWKVNTNLNQYTIEHEWIYVQRITHVRLKLVMNLRQPTIVAAGRRRRRGRIGERGGYRVTLRRGSSSSCLLGLWAVALMRVRH